MPQPVESTFASSIVEKVLIDLVLRRRFLVGIIGFCGVGLLMLVRLLGMFLMILSLIAVV
jgi:hypothetical protein